MGKTEEQKETEAYERLTDKHKNILKKLYFSDKNYTGRDQLWHLVKEKNPNIQRRAVMAWLRRQETYQLTAPTRKPRTIRPIITTRINDLWEVDLIVMRGGRNISNDNITITRAISKELKDSKKGQFNDADGLYKYIMTVVDALSKKAYAEPLINKTEDYVIKALSKVFKQAKSKPKRILTDNGSEFQKKFDAFLGEHEIRHIRGVAESPMTQGLVERFNGNLKRYLKRYFIETGRNDWATMLPTFIKNYNNSYHSSIKMTPDEVNDTNETAISDMLRNKALKKGQIPPNNLDMGDVVRVAIQPDGVGKRTQNYSSNTFEIIKVIRPKNITGTYSYRLKHLDGVDKQTKKPLKGTKLNGNYSRTQLLLVPHA